MKKNTKIPHCENISKVQQKNRTNKLENKKYPTVQTVRKVKNKKSEK